MRFHGVPKKIVCYHHNDNDGVCAASIVGRAFPSIPVAYVRCDYDRDVPTGMLTSDTVVVIVDFSFDNDVMSKIINAVGNEQIHWLDHHMTSLEKDYGVDILGIRVADSLAGCELAWQYFMGDEMPLAVRLIGDYDTWRDPYKVGVTEFMLATDELVEAGPKDKRWQLLFDSSDLVEKYIADGHIIRTYRESMCRKMTANGYEAMLDDQPCFCVNTTMPGNAVFFEKLKDYPLCVTYTHTGDLYKYGVYSSSLDVSKIAEKHGGGGHKGAAGFSDKDFIIKKV